MFYLTPGVVPFPFLDKSPCLVLLGTPGMGKSTEIERQAKAIIDVSSISKTINLQECHTDWGLFRAIFDDQTFRDWVDGKHDLHLFLDDLDLCPLGVNTLAKILRSELKKYPLHRLYLRIACRSGRWSQSLEDELKKLWTDVDAVAVYELAPLRQEDVIEAAVWNDVEPEAFLQAIDDGNIVPLAIRPVTLTFLLNTYKREGRFPSTQVKLYKEGCRQLCEEINQDRRDAGLTGNLNADGRLAVAARIAATTIFCQRYAVWIGADQADVSDSDVTIRTLSSVSTMTQAISERDIEETLATGLFTAVGRQRMGWAHQTYAEFLAARYVQEMSREQVMSLLIHPDDPEGRIVPQLHETAAWIAGMRPDVFRAIMKIDPEVLLRSDVATAEPQDRASLVEILLEFYDAEKLLASNWTISQHYHKLNHPTLAEQLRPYIGDRNRSWSARRVATDIAEVCNLRTLQEDLLAVALDASELLPIRVNNALAIVRIGDEVAKARLKALALVESDDDPQDELKGCSLLATWPGHMTPHELFKALTLPKDSCFFGLYQQFLSSDPIKHILPTDLPIALEWAETQATQRRQDMSDGVGISKVFDAIMLQAWDHLAEPGVAEAFARVAFARLLQYEAIIGIRQYYRSSNGHQPEESFETSLLHEHAKRRLVIEAVLPLLSSSDSERDPLHLVFAPTPIVTNEDTFWLLERLSSEESEEVQRILAQLIERAFDQNNLDQLNAVLTSSEQYPVLAEKLHLLIQPVPLNSPEAEIMKSNYLKRWHRNNQEQNTPRIQPAPAERVAILLSKCEAGDTAAWWQLNMELTLEPTSTRYGSDFEPDLTNLPGWKAADNVTRARIIEAAKKYIQQQDPENHQWMGTDSCHRSALAGYRALLLLLQETPGFISLILPEIWKRWASIVVIYPLSSTLEKESLHQILLAETYRQAANEVIDCLMLLIDQQNKKNNSLDNIGRLNGCWDPKLAQALLCKVRQRDLTPPILGQLLDCLLDHGVSEAQSFAESLVTLGLANEEQRAEAIVAARILITHTPDAGWSVVWPVIQQDTQFGQTLIESIAHRHDLSPGILGQRLSEDQVADLYVWLNHQYPPAEDIRLGEAFCVGPRESIAMWRDDVLTYLKNRGTKQACAAIQNIMQDLPELDWLKWVLLEAQAITRRHTWNPPKPEHILSLAQDQQKRLVRSGDELLEVIIESLKRLQVKLRGETPAVVDLWNEDPCKPKREDSLSDYIKRHLDEDLVQRGIIVNREVVIRTGSKGPRDKKTPGERTDVHVDALTPHLKGEGYDSVTVIIEVKGCWNSGLSQAMETQLVGRYLKDNQCRHGLYLVGWFNCKEWNGYFGKQKAPKLSAEEAQRQFDQQAAALSVEGVQVRVFVLNTGLS